MNAEPETAGTATLDRRMSMMLAALAHPARLRILRHLSGNTGCCCKEVVGQLDLAQSTVSQHLKILVDAGLVRFAPDRQRSRYTLDAEALRLLSSELGGFLASCCPET